VLLEARSLNLDLVVSPHRSFRTALFVGQLGRVATRIGFRDWWSRFAFNKSVHRDLSLHDVERQLSLLAPLGAGVQRLTEMKLEVPGSPVNSIFKEAVVLAPGSQWATKRWTESGFVSVGRHYQKQGQTVVLIGTADEAELCARIAAEIPGAVSVAGSTDLMELARGLRSAKVLLCNDSGAMHLGVAVGARVVSVFGATVPAQGYAPWSKTARIVEVDLNCRPCGRHGHDKCPLGTHDCMKLVTPELVLRAMSESFAK
jgi:heptosyltransferase-2